MLLAIDIGNTQTVLGLFEDAKLRQTWRLASDLARTPDELSATVSYFFTSAHQEQKASPATNGAIIASVVPALTTAWAELARRFTGGVEPLLVSASKTGGVVLNIDNPAEVGADRIANAAAARQLYGAPAVVLDFGTATNIDVIDECGAYVGGVISPGVETSAQALFASAARLPVIDLELPLQVLGTTTKTAVQSGLLYGEAAKMDALLRALKAEHPCLDAEEVPVIATGGLAKLIAPLVSQVTHQDPDLTLKGLYLIAMAEMGAAEATKGVHA